MSGPLIIGLAGDTLTPEDQAILTHPLIGGVIFFKHNYLNPIQLQQLVAHIREIRPTLLLCVDQEGGRIQSLGLPLTLLPPISVAKTREQAFYLAQLMALEVRALGLDLSLAPVVDLNKHAHHVIGDRAFSHDPMRVTTLAHAYIQGMQSVGMCCVLKHFPGHGTVLADSHAELPIDTRDYATLEKDDLYPFAELIENANPEGIMPAHIQFPKIAPAIVGFSAYWLQTILRQRLQFQGAIISDTIDMLATTSLGDFKQRFNLALKAGCDYVLLCNRQVLKEILTSDIVDPALNDENIVQRRKLLKAKVPFLSFEELKTDKRWLHAKAQVELFT